MKVSLILLTPGKLQGETLVINRPLFVIGRGTSCHLRISCQTVSKRHCTFALRNGRVYVQDCGSRNGTLLNGRTFEGEVELQGDGRLQVGRLEFAIQIEGAPLKAVSDEEAAAAAFLAMEEVENPGPSNENTLVEGASPKAETDPEIIPPLPVPGPPAPAKQREADTSAAAKRLLKMYSRR